MTPGIVVPGADMVNGSIRLGSVPSLKTMMALAPAAVTLLYLIVKLHTPRLTRAIPGIGATGPHAKGSDAKVTAADNRDRCWPTIRGRYPQPRRNRQQRSPVRTLQLAVLNTPSSWVAPTAVIQGTPDGVPTVPAPGPALPLDVATKTPASAANRNAMSSGLKRSCLTHQLRS